jgi:hypothetical protein
MFEVWSFFCNSLRLIKPFINSPNLKKIDLSSCSQLNNPHITDCLVLEDLNFQSSPVEASSILNIVDGAKNFTGCPNLKNIDLKFCNNLENLKFNNKEIKIILK